MLPENRTSLERFRHQYNAWVKDKCSYQYDWQEVLRIVREEWDPYRSVDHWCGACVMKLLVDAFDRMATEAAPPMETDTVRIKL